ncbi:Calx-beta domain-containing protein, partial [Microcoleus sp. herbarium8]|uniref:choice-of-anchor Y domain-containing protein n=1 Tax=Microcoleus sp. herbarium8 TaxID=3055436 RepID=UPI002FD7579B
MGQIIINEFRRATGDWTGNEYVELLLTEDLTATQLQSYFVGDSTIPTTAKYSAYQFTNMASIAPVFKAGTIIAIGGSPANQEIAYNPIPSGTNNDWNIRLSLEGGFLRKLLPVGNFDGDFAASDVVYVDNTSTTNFDTVDAIAWRTSGTHGAFGSAAKVQIAAPNNGGTVEFSSALGGVNRTANYAVNSLGSIGLPNGGINTIYINSLRNREVNGAPILDTSVNPLELFMNEDLPSANNRGINIYAYLYDVVSDPNGYPYGMGMAVTGVDNTNGNWQFSTNGGNNWTDFGTVSESSATVLGPTFLYSGLVGNTPSPQGWLNLTNLNAASPATTASEIFSGNGSNLNSTAADSIYAGYSSHTALGTPLNSSFPLLDRNAGSVTVGFEISFNLQIISESRTNPNEAGFSIVVVTSDRKAIEIGFQQLSATSGKIFAKADGITPNPGGQPNGLFLPAENIAYDTNRATNYTLSIQGDSYSLFSEVNDGSPMFGGVSELRGPLRDYSAFSGAIDPYETPNFLFLGDNATEAQANINLTQVFWQNRSNPRVRFLPNPDYYSTPGSEPKITFRAWDGSNGIASGTKGVNASVTGGTTPFSTNSITSPIAVIPVNDAPSFVKGPDRTLNRNAGPQTVPGWATAIFPGPANESAQTVNFQVVGNDNTGLFSVLPAIDSAGQLTFTPAIGATGTANITLNLKDNGGIANGGVDTSVNQTFIINVNNPSTFNFSAANYSVNENGNSATITVTRTDAANVAADVSYSTSNGSANAGSDYTATSGTLNFAIGETTKDFTIPIIDDILVEGDETVNIRLVSPTNGADLGTISTAVVTIVDTTPIPTPTPTPTPAENPIPIPTPTPAENPIPIPTPTPTPAENPIPIPIPTPTPAENPIPISTPTPAENPIPISTPTPA